MRNLIAAPVILLAVMVQSAIISRITLLSGFADLPLVMLAAWALQDEVDTAWHWAIATGVLVGFVSGLPWFAPVISYAIVVFMAQNLQKRIWQAPLLGMFTVTSLGTLVANGVSYLALTLSGISISLTAVLGLITLPAILMNLFLAIIVYVVMRDIARWVYPAPEVE
jgi:cell shape-determining protein MreD